MTKTKKREKCKPFQFWNEDIKLFPRGVSRKRVSGRLASSADVSRSPRGKITTFSRHSSLRLRRALLENAPEDPSQFVELGLTLTVPWDVAGYSDERIAADYKIAFNRFSTAFRRRFPHSLVIFRHELQKRRAPHSHFVCWLSNIDFNFVHRGRSATASDFRAIVFAFWSRAVLGSDHSESFVYPVRRVSGFHRYGIKVDVLNDSLSIFRYLADHASKHKKSQLGYKGKQWGFINRKLFVASPHCQICFDRENDFVCFFRHLSKVCRYRLSSDSLSRRSNNKSVIFVSDRVSIPLGDSVLSGRVCLQDDLPANVFVERWYILLRALLEVSSCNRVGLFDRVGFALLNLLSRRFVICSLLPHIPIYEKQKKVYIPI